MKKILVGFNQADNDSNNDKADDESASSSGEESEGEDDEEDKQPAPSSVINISIYNKKTQRNELFRVHLKCSAAVLSNHQL